MRTLLGLLVALVAVSACTELPAPSLPKLGSFAVTQRGVYVNGSLRRLLDVVPPCARKYGDQTRVPADVRGTADCRYVIPTGDVEIDLSVTALDPYGKPAKSFSGPVSFRIVPGDLRGDYPGRQAQLTNGEGTATIPVAHLYSEVRVWAEDAPPSPLYTDGGTSIPPGSAPDAGYTYATGVTAPIYFEEPTLAKVQYPDAWDNRFSPFTGEFMAIGRNPESGSVLTHNCAADPVHDGQPALLVVTGIDSAGFFVTDVSSCRMPEDLSASASVRVPEPDGYYPGTFGSIYIYNYSYPEGLYTGDALWSLSGSVQEFTSTTQLTFAAWSIREKVRLLPADQWTKYLRLAPPVELNLRICSLDQAPFVTDSLCGHNRKSLKVESLESALVKVRNVKFPEVFKACDRNADGEVVSFCEGKPDGVNWGWGACGPLVAGDPEGPERQCNIDCTNGLGAYAGKVCSELTNYNGFGQFIIELAGPGPAEAGLDPSLAGRLRPTPVGGTSVPVGGFAPGAQLRVWCDAAVRYRFGDDSVAADAGDFVLAANTLLEHTLGAGQTAVALLAADAAAPANCTVAENSHTRMNVFLRDAVPNLEINCSTADPDPAKARQCVALRAARYDLVGHLRQVQAARPRWMIMPRDPDDICCHPGPGLQCPTPIKPCP